MKKTKEDELPAKPPTPPNFKVCRLHINVSDDRYVGLVESINFCGNKLCLIVREMHKITPGSIPGTWLKIAKFDRYTFEFHCCRAQMEKSNEERRVFESSTNDEIVLSNDTDDCAAIVELLTTEA